MISKDWEFFSCSWTSQNSWKYNACYYSKIAFTIRVFCVLTPAKLFSHVLSALYCTSSIIFMSKRRYAPYAKKCRAFIIKYKFIQRALKSIHRVLYCDYYLLNSLQALLGFGISYIKFKWCKHYSKQPCLCSEVLILYLKVRANSCWDVWRKLVLHECFEVLLAILQ